MADLPQIDLLNDPRPRVLLPGDNRLLSKVAAEIGEHLGEYLYLHGGEVVTVADGSVHHIGTQQFRTIIERRIIPCRRRPGKSGSYEVGVSMSESDARGVLASPQFREQLRPLKCVNAVRLPVMRRDGRIELLPIGYDVDAKTLTLGGCEYADSMPSEQARTFIADLYSEFRFADGGRSKAVAVSALIGLFAQGLLPDGALRPCFVFTANAEGAGKGTLAACCIVPLLGHLPTATLPEENAETRKMLTSLLRQGARVILFDNVRHTIGGASLEAFCSAPTWQDRLLCENKTLTMKNEATLIITSNGAICKPDMRRRSLFAVLHLSEERGEDRRFRRPLSPPDLLKLRPQILAACWAMVRHWSAMGRPRPSRSHAHCPEWASTIGGIVECAGFGCPLETAEVAIAADVDGDQARELVGTMDLGKQYTPGGMAALCRQVGVFGHLVGESESDMGQSSRISFGRLLQRYVDRNTGNRKLAATGKNATRRYTAVLIEGGTRESESGESVSPLSSKNIKNHPRRKHSPDSSSLRTDEGLQEVKNESNQDEYVFPFRSDSEPVSPMANGKDHATMQPEVATRVERVSSIRNGMLVI